MCSTRVEKGCYLKFDAISDQGEQTCDDSMMTFVSSISADVDLVQPKKRKSLTLEDPFPSASLKRAFIITQEQD